MKADSDNSMIIESIDTSNMCSHLQKKLLEDDGILKFQTLVDYFGSYALVEISLLLLVILPTVAVYIFTKE